MQVINDRGVIVHRVDKDHLGSYLDFRRIAHAESPNEIRSISEEELPLFKKALADRKRHHVVVVQVGSLVVAHISMVYSERKGSVDMRSLYVLKNYRHQGFSKLLLEKLDQFYKSTGASMLTHRFQHTHGTNHCFFAKFAGEVVQDPTNIDGASYEFQLMG